MFGSHKAVLALIKKKKFFQIARLTVNFHMHSKKTLKNKLILSGRINCTVHANKADVECHYQLPLWSATVWSALFMGAPRPCFEILLIQIALELKCATIRN